MKRVLMTLVAAIAASLLVANAAVAEGPGPDDLRAKAEHLQREAEMLFRQAEEMERGHQPGPPHHGPPHEPEHRARMLNEAADHIIEAAKRLHEADVHELAEGLEREAERIREEVRKQMHVNEAHEVIGGLREAIDDLRRDLDGLRDRVNELRGRMHRR